MKKITGLRIWRLKRWGFIFLLPIALISLYIASRSREVAEHVFARGIFVGISWVMSHVSGIVPFSLMELGIILLPFLTIGVLFWFAVGMLRRKEDRGFRVAKAFLNLGCVVSVAAFLLIFGCSINYYRYSVGEYLGLTVEPATGEELYRLVVQLAEKTSAVREELKQCEDANGVYSLTMSTRQLGREAVKAYHTLSQKHEIFEGYYPEPKGIFFSRTMSRTELTGIFCPFTMEANVNTDISPYSIASTMCHELAHLKGFIREDEANYIAYLACTDSDSAELRYSGLMEALILSGNALYRKNAELYKEARQYFSDGVVRDLIANSEYWKQFEDTPISRTANKVNDTYLKANNQEDGVQSYGRMVDLLLAEFRKEGGVK